MTASVSPADLNKVADLLIDEGKLDAAKAVKDMAAKYDEQLKAAHLESLGGTAKAAIGWNALKEIRANLDGVRVFDELSYGKKIEYATFANAVEKAHTFYSLPVGTKAQITGPQFTARGFPVEGFKLGDTVYIKSLPDNDGDVQISRQIGTWSQFNSMNTVAYIKVTSLTAVPATTRQDCPF